MTDLSNPWPNWGEQGELPPNGFFYEGGDQVNEKHLDSLWNTQDTGYQSLIDGITSRIEDIQGNIRLDTGLTVSQSNGLETTVTASTAGAYVNGQQTGETSQRTLTHSTNGGSVDRTDAIWVDIDGQVGKTENTTSVAANRFKIAEVVVTPSDTIGSISNVAPRITSVFASESEPVDTDNGDVWLDTSSNRLKGKQSGAFRTLVTDQDSLSITAGSGLSGGGSVDVFNGTTSLSLTNDSVTVTPGSNLSGGGTVALGESITLDVNTTNLDADTVDGFEAAELGLDIEDNGTTTVNNSVGLNFTDNFTVTDDGDNTASVTLQQGSGSGLDADTLDGNEASYFTTLTEVNNNADVPNADFADEAGNATTLDNLDSTDFGRKFVGVQAPVFASTADVPTSISEGELVYISGDGLYVEDGT